LLLIEGSCIGQICDYAIFASNDYWKKNQEYTIVSEKPLAYNCNSNHLQELVRPKLLKILNDTIADTLLHMIKNQDYRNWSFEKCQNHNVRIFNQKKVVALLSRNERRKQNLFCEEDAYKYTVFQLSPVIIYRNIMILQYKAIVRPLSSVTNLLLFTKTGNQWKLTLVIDSRAS
jgi:hypothetical protein